MGLNFTQFERRNALRWDHKSLMSCFKTPILKGVGGGRGRWDKCIKKWYDLSECSCPMYIAKDCSIGTLFALYLNPWYI